MSRNDDRLGLDHVPQDDGATAAVASTTEQNTATAPAFNWSVPTEFVELPSEGTFYPPGHPLHNERTIEIRFMTAKEEDILTSQSLLRKGIAFDKVLENLIVEKVDLDSLLVGDKNALMIAARALGCGKDYKVTVTDPNDP